MRVPRQTYAVFRHDGHVSEIRRTWKTIFGKESHYWVILPLIALWGIVGLITLLP